MTRKIHEIVLKYPVYSKLPLKEIPHYRKEETPSCFFPNIWHATKIFYFMIRLMQNRKLGVHCIWTVIPEERTAMHQEQAAIVQIL